MSSTACSAEAPRNPETGKGAPAGALIVLAWKGFVGDSIVDGPGLRCALFTQGCPHGCPGCHNPQSHDPAGGYDMDIAEIVEKVKKNPLLAGITLTGGEPLLQAEACLALVRLLPPGLNVWLYSGWTYDEIMEKGDAQQSALVQACDVMVDGRFLLAERSLSLRYCGSRNQRLVDIKKTLAEGRVILWEVPVW